MNPDAIGMTDEDLAEIDRAIADCCYPWDPLDLVHAENLLAEVRRLRAENAALRAEAALRTPPSGSR